MRSAREGGYLLRAMENRVIEAVCVVSGMWCTSALIRWAIENVSVWLVGGVALAGLSLLIDLGMNGGKL